MHKGSVAVDSSFSKLPKHLVNLDYKNKCVRKLRTYFKRDPERFRMPLGDWSVKSLDSETMI